MNKIEPGMYDVHTKKQVIPNNLPSHVAPAAMLAFGRFSLSPVHVGKKTSKSYLSLDYEIIPNRSLII